MKAFKLNGWTIKPCSETRHEGFAGRSYDVTAPGEHYHYDDLEGAVDAAQRRPVDEPEPELAQLPPALSGELYRILEDGRRGGIQGGIDYTFKDLESTVLDALNEVRKGQS